MNRIYICALLISLFVLNAKADYCVRTTNSNSSRYLKSVSFQGGYYSFSPLTIASSGYSAVYYDKTSKVFYANAGSTITPQIEYEGSWMQGYVYIDYDNDGAFNTTNELVAYSGYMQNGVWRNSKGEQVADGGVCPPGTVPSFIIPESIPSGDYRMRVKVDWDSPDPCGRTSATGNSMEQNGGAIVDLTLRLTGITYNYTITVDNEYTKEFVLSWEDEFNERSLNEKVWSKIEPYESGNPDWRKNISTYDDCFDFRDGNIVLRGIRNPGSAITGDTRTYLCGGIESWGKKSFKDGRVEIRAKTTSAQGAWPALWMMPEDQSAGWPGCGEIDIFEHLNYDSFVYQTLHSNYTYNVSKENPLSHITASVDVSEYNVYGVELSSDTIKLLLNDNVTMAYPNTGANDQFPYSKDFYLILDMQLGGSWVGSVTGVNLPVEMSLDWVRFYKKYETGGKLYVKTLENKIISSGESVPENTVLLITAVPVDGYELESLVVNGEDVTDEHNISGTYLYMPTSETSIATTYKKTKMIVNYSVEGGVQLFVTGEDGRVIENGDKVASGEIIFLNIQPVEGESLISCLVNGEDKSSEIMRGENRMVVTSDIDINIKYTDSSGVEEEEEKLVEVYVASNAIVIDTPYPEEVLIYNASGMIFESRIMNGRNEVVLPAGLYLVKVGGNVYKVLL